LEHNTDFKDSVKSRLNKEIVSDIVQALGFDFDRNGAFKLHDEKTASSRIDPRTLNIKDFGGDFSGDIIALVQHQNQTDFIQALNYIAPFVGMLELETYNTKTPVPRPLPTATPEQDLIEDGAKKQRNQRIIAQHRQNFTSERAYKGLKELYPCINTVQGLEHLLGWSTYNNDNSLTITFDEVTTVRYAQATQHSPATKWKTFGSKKFIPFKINPADNFVYLYSGMAEIIAMEIMGLSFIGLQADQMDRHITDEIKTALIGKTIVVLEENDESSKKLSQRIVKNFPKVKILNLGALASRTDKGFDLRDYVNHLNSFEIARTIIEATANALPTETKTLVAGTAQEFLIRYSGQYITNGQNQIDIETLKRAVIIAKTGAGKTYPFENKPDVLILIPRVEQATVYAGEDTNFLIGSIISHGAMITYDKFYGHFSGNTEFRNMIMDGQIKLIVDEAHTLLYNSGSKASMLIYAMDALFMSGTLEPFFRKDLPRYKFIPEEKTKIFYTNNKIPDFKNALYFVNRAEAIVKNYNKAIIGAERSRQLQHTNYKIHEYEDGQVFATEALREGVSIHGNFEAVVVDAGTCANWSIKDIIQGLARPRKKDCKRIITKPIEDEKEYRVNFEQTLRRVQDLHDIPEVNAALGEFHSSLTKNAMIATGYQRVTEFGVACYLAYKTRNQYDKDLYAFEEFKGIEAELELKLSLDDTRDEDENNMSFKIGNTRYSFDKKHEKRMRQWSRLKKAGTTKGLMKYKSKWTSLNTFYYNSKFVAGMRKGIKARHHKAQYTIRKTYTDLKRIVKVEFKNNKGQVVKRVNDNTELKNLYFKVIDECPIEHTRLKDDEASEPAPEANQNMTPETDSRTAHNSFKFRGQKQGISPPA